MIDALYISATGLRSQQEQIDVISNNVANMQTPGFKRSRVNFAEIAALGAPGENAAAGLADHGGGTRILSTSTMFGAGDLRPTGNPLDLAIEGEGFFELENAAGERVYTRAGQFRVDDEGYVVSVNGMRLAQGLQGPPDALDVRIGRDGEITARLGDDPERSVVGQIELATFAAPDALEAAGQNVFALTEGSGEPSIGRPGESGYGHLQQGYLEMANVDLVDEMTNLVMAQRAYQLNARVLQASDQLLETINNLRR
jgi:flagellar basal-body rod protein FlgG